jgi:hypothetical protein
MDVANIAAAMAACISFEVGAGPMVGGMAAGMGNPKFGNMLALNMGMPRSPGRALGSMGMEPGMRPAFENMAALNIGFPAGMPGMPGSEGAGIAAGSRRSGPGSTLDPSDGALLFTLSSLLASRFDLRLPPPSSLMTARG